MLTMLQINQLRTDDKQKNDRLPPLPPGFTPEGVERALIDQQTLSLIEHAVPGGRDVFLHLLSYATISPETAMECPLRAATGGSSDEAIALISSIHALAKSPMSPFKSPDAYLRRLLVLEYLQVIRRIFHRTYTEFRIPLGRRTFHIPSLLASLWNLHEEYKDEKVKQLARKVARRLQQMGGGMAHLTAHRQTSHAPDLAPVREVLSSILEAHGLREDPTFLMQACSIIAGLLLPETFGRVDEKVGEFLSSLRRRRPAAPNSGEFVSKSDDSVAGEGYRPDQLRTVRKHEMGDSVMGNSPIFKGNSRNRRKERCHSGEFAALFPLNSPEFGGERQISAKPGESEPVVSMIALSSEDITTNGETIINTTTSGSENPPACIPPVQLDNRPLEAIRREAKFYESFFDNGRSRKWTGSLINVLRQTPNEVKRLAAVGAVYYSYFPQPDGRTVYNPGGWFTSACRRYGQPGAGVPFEIRAWSETNLSLSEIRRRLKEGIRLPKEWASPRGGEQEAVELRNTLEPGKYQEEPQSEEAMIASWDNLPLGDDSAQIAYPLPVATTRSCMGNWMDYEQAEQLRDRILHEGKEYRLHAVVRPGQGSRWTVVVAWPDGVEVEVINEEDWIDYFREVKGCLDELSWETNTSDTAAE